jgi:RNA polymerase sigma factor (sigma-70 family)
MDGDGSMRERPGPTAEPEQFSRWVEDHYSPALRYAERLLRSSAEAEDCVQEAFAEVFTGLHTLRDPQAAPAWIRSIVRHRCLRRLRRRDLALIPLADELETSAATSLAADAEGRQQRRAFAARLLTSLPDHEREIVILFYLKECSQQEIASFLGLPLSTVNNRLHDARRRMKQWEAHMHENPRPLAARDNDNVSRVGTLLSLNGPLVEARFDADAPLDIFDAVAVVGGDGKPVERMKVCRRLGGGRVQCLLTEQHDEPLEPGMSLLDTGKVALDASPFRGRVPGVSPPTLLAALQALRVEPAPASDLLETGIKAIDLLCPLAAQGVAIQVGMAGVGRMVLLEELARRLEHSPQELTFFCLVERSEPDAYRGWDESALRGHRGNTRFYWALADHGTDPAHPALDAAAAALYLSPVLALKGLYPAIDPEHSRSRLLAPQFVGERHVALATRAREALLLCKRVEADSTLLELLACHAFAAARRRYRELEQTTGDADPVQLGRARKLRAFLTQPFGVVSDLTGWPGVEVALEDTLEGCRAILDGDVDELPLDAFPYAGALDDVRERARAGVRRVYG